MRKWLKLSLVGVLGASVLLGGMAAYSHRTHSHWGSANMSQVERGEWRASLVERAGSKLDLDTAQKAKLSALAATLSAQRKVLVGDSSNPRAEMQALIAAEQFDKQAAQALVESKTSALRQASPGVIDAMADFYDSLKVEQQQKLRDLLNRGGRHRGWRS